jgi:5-methyltetrahydrofolate--homocysteine methyltransferase
MAENLERIEKAITELELENIGELVKEGLDSGEEAGDILDAMCSGMTKVGELFETGEYFLADLVLAGETMKDGLVVLEPHLAADSLGRKGTVVLCTVKGDIHDIGKNLVATMLQSSGFNVVDLGSDVHEDRVVEAVRSNSAQAVCLSVLLTSMVNSIGETVQALEAAGLRDQVKIAIGGACTTTELADKMGVDALGRDAIEAVRIFEGFMG